MRTICRPKLQAVLLPSWNLSANCRATPENYGLSSRGTVLAIPLTQTAVGPFAASNVCVREMTPHAYPTNSSRSEASEPPSVARGHCRTDFGPFRIHASESGRRHHQSGRASFTLRNHGDQRNHVKGHGSFSDRRAEQEGRHSRQEARGGGRQSPIGAGPCSGKSSWSAET